MATKRYYAELGNWDNLILHTKSFDSRADLDAYLDLCKARRYVEGTVIDHGGYDWTPGDFITVPLKKFGGFRTEVMTEEGAR